MSKAHRGKGILEHAGKARGACPVCGRTGLKLLYEVTLSGDKKANVCKQCRKKAA
jgi:hypothetical protein